MRNYKSGIFICKLRLNEECNGVEFDVPFYVYGFNCVAGGVDITSRLNDVKLVGTEVVAKLDYRIVDEQGLPNDKEIAEKHEGLMGNDFSVIQKDARYLKHYAVTKADKLATYSELGVKIPYDEADKDEVTKFCNWTEDVKEIDPIVIKPIEKEIDIKVLTK